ncbi:MAG: Eco57I restriction-modification methylase domain-containing protein [Coriobacteriales bacterium]|jgi:hypothetical protein|nr:Eco57I restriction-modification methylase domain-containing protein [Coriobacteriales bacterium]
MNKSNNGVVFTKEWIVELMLDCCGYTSDKNLAASLIIEPSCGQGAFLIPIVRRLIASTKKYSCNIADLYDSIRAFELDEQHIKECWTMLFQLLINEGIDIQTAEKLLDCWLVNSDFLLCETFRKADYVIGNPPYIRGTEIDRVLREKYIRACKTMTAGTDIYVGFIETGLRYLKPNGVLNFICADRWMHNAYGKKLRKLVSENYSVDIILKMPDVDAFNTEVSAYPAIIQISKTPQSIAASASMTELFTEESVPELIDWLHNGAGNSCLKQTFSGYWHKSWFRTDDVWPVTSPDVITLLEKLNSQYHPLQNKTTETQVGIGVATGRDDVFILHDPTLVEKCLLLPLVTSAQTRSGRIEGEKVWLFNPWDNSGNLIDIEQYPLARKYLESHQESLRSRHVAKKSCEKSWYRTIDKVYPGLVNMPKLLIQDMKSYIQPILDKGDYYPHHNLYWITSEQWDLEVLGGLLISDVARMTVGAYCVKMRGGTLRLQAQYLRKIRLPEPSAIDFKLQAELVDAFRNDDRSKASEAAMQAYDLKGFLHEKHRICSC